MTVKPTKRLYINVSFYNRDTTRSVYYTNIMLEKGSIANEFSPNPNEVYDGVTSIDKDGITVTASNVKSKTSMSASGFKITKTDTNEDIFKVNSDGTLALKGRMTITGGSVPTSSLDGTISSSQLNSSITTDINNAKNNASSALSTANTAKSTADSAKSTATAASTNATNALNTANAVNKVVNDNKVNWSSAYDRVKEWAYGAVSGSTTIDGGLIQTNTILADKIAIGDFTNYCVRPTNHIMTNSKAPAYMVTPNTNQHVTITNKLYTLKGGEKFRVTGRISNGTGSPNSSFTISACWRAEDGTILDSSNVSTASLAGGEAETMNKILTIPARPSMAHYLGIKIYISSSDASAKMYWYNPNIKLMADGELIVDGSITAANFMQMLLTVKLSLVIL